MVSIRSCGNLIPSVAKKIRRPADETPIGAGAVPQKSLPLAKIARPGDPPKGLSLGIATNPSQP